MNWEPTVNDPRAMTLTLAGPLKIHVFPSGQGWWHFSVAGHSREDWRARSREAAQQEAIIKATELFQLALKQMRED